MWVFCFHHDHIPPLSVSAVPSSPATTHRPHHTRYITILIEGESCGWDYGVGNTGWIKVVALDFFVINSTKLDSPTTHRAYVNMLGNTSILDWKQTDRHYITSSNAFCIAKQKHNLYIRIGRVVKVILYAGAGIAVREKDIDFVFVSRNVMLQSTNVRRFFPTLVGWW